MARSTYVYMVLNQGVPCAAFTVKHECVTFLENINNILPLTVQRFPDGGRGLPSKEQYAVDFINS